MAILVHGDVDACGKQKTWTVDAGREDSTPVFIEQPRWHFPAVSNIDSME